MFLSNEYPFIGKVIGVFGYVKNITERKNVEDELRKREVQLDEVQQIADIGSWEIEPSTNRMTWSDELYRIYGLRHQEFEITYEDFIERAHTAKDEEQCRVDSLRNTEPSHRLKLLGTQARHPQGLNFQIIAAHLYMPPNAILLNHILLKTRIRLSFQ